MKKKWNVKLRAVLKRFRSDSNPFLKHEIRRGADGKIYCTCMGWRFHRTCWHLDAFFMQLSRKAAA